MAAPSIRVLHVFPTFAPGGAQTRATELMSAFGPSWGHAVLALDGVVSARERVAPGVAVELLPPPPRAGTLATTARLRRLLDERRADLVLTYNFGAIDAVLAARTLDGVRLVHHEDGFHADEARRLKLRRSWLRQVALSAAARVVVISRNLERIALGAWRQPRERVVYVPNGIDVERFSRAGDRDALRRSLGVPDEAVLVGCVGHLRPEKNVERLLQASAYALRNGAHLHVLVLGDGPERRRLEELAARAPLAGRVHLVGHQPDPSGHYGAMDLLAIPSDTEQQPLALLEAMASGLPAACTDVGDVREMLPPEQGAWVVPAGPGAEERLGEALVGLAADAAGRRRLGDANRARARARFRREGMVEAYRHLYQEVLAGGAAGAAGPSA
jgi:glycosyltransferase involved in cell wall biosynthesis